MFYSRDREHYTYKHKALPRRPAFYTLGNITAAVEILETAGLIDHWKTSPSPFARYRSRIRATPELIARLGPLSITNFVFTAGPRVILRGADGKMLTLPKSRAIGRMQRDVEAHNDFLSGFDVRIAHAEAAYDSNGFLRVGKACISPSH